MAVINESLTYYNKNVLRSLPNWNILSNASVVGSNININSGGVAGCDLNNNYFNGLNASKYRQVTIKVEATMNESTNYQNYIELLLRGVYKDNDGKQIVAYMSVNASLINSSYNSGVLTFSRVMTMENIDFDSCAVYIVNHTSSTIQLQECSMLRSQDISSSQVGDSIGWGITLNQVVSYLDGCEIFYDGVQNPDKLWWMEDSDGNFSGINVNNDRMIKFSRKNEILLD